MKKCFLLILIIFSFSYVFGQEEMLFETTWEIDIPEIDKIILLKDMMWIQIKNDYLSSDTFIASEIIYSDGKILTKNNLGEISVLFYYEIIKEKVNLSFLDENININQISSSNDLIEKTKFQGIWFLEDEYGEREGYIFYGHYFIHLSNSGVNEVTLVMKFDYNDKQIITSIGSEKTYTNYLILDNKLIFLFNGEEKIFYKY